MNFARSKAIVGQSKYTPYVTAGIVPIEPDTFVANIQFIVSQFLHFRLLWLPADAGGMQAATNCWNFGDHFLNEGTDAIPGVTFPTCSTNYFVNPSLVLATSSPEGWHDVWVGLRGLPADAQQTWQRVRLNYDHTPPALVITSPTATSGSIPLLQLQGYCPEPLASLTFDVSNAAGSLSGQQGLVLSQFYDTNLHAFTTNFFQCFDLDCRGASKPGQL